MPEIHDKLKANNENSLVNLGGEYSDNSISGWVKKPLLSENRIVRVSVSVTYATTGIFLLTGIQHDVHNLILKNNDLCFNFHEWFNELRGLSIESIVTYSIAIIAVVLAVECYKLSENNSSK